VAWPRPDLGRQRHKQFLCSRQQSVPDDQVTTTPFIAIYAA